MVRIDAQVPLQHSSRTQHVALAFPICLQTWMRKWRYNNPQQPLSGGLEKPLGLPMQAAALLRTNAALPCPWFGQPPQLWKSKDRTCPPCIEPASPAFGHKASRAGTCPSSVRYLWLHLRGAVIFAIRSYIGDISLYAATFATFALV